MNESKFKKRKLNKNEVEHGKKMIEKTNKFFLGTWNKEKSDQAQKISYNPFVLGEYSLSKDGHRKYHEKVNIPEIKNNINFPIDLNIGFNDWQDNSKIPNLDSLFTWICKNNCSMSSIALITYRGLLKKIAVTKFDHFHNHWCVRLSKIGSTLIMDEVETIQKKTSKDTETQQQKRFQYYGHKFEDDVLDYNDPDPAENNIVVTSKIGNIRCILAAEVDGKAKDGHIIELKTHRLLENAHHKSNFEKGKLMNTYMQCYLAGIENTCFGFRDQQGFVHHMTHYKISEIEEMCCKHWNKDMFLTFLFDVLSWAIPLVESDKVYHMSYLGSDNIELKLVQTVNYIPDWFIKFASKSFDEDD